MKQKLIYIVCPVRGMTDEERIEMEDYVKNLRAQDCLIHYPPDSVDQTDPTGFNICLQHFEAMRQADEVHLFWNVSSFGSHFDLGMFFALRQINKNKPKLVLVKLFQEDMAGKSYVKVIQMIIEEQNLGLDRNYSGFHCPQCGQN